MSDDRIFAKCARRLIPFMMAAYVVNNLDRTNVAFAALTMNRDLGFTPAIFGIGAGAVYLSYSLFQVPANIVLYRLGARRWMFCILLAWGAISASNALIADPISFYLLRFLVGAAEAGFLPGMLLYLSYWFAQSHLARFTAIFMASPFLAIVIGGPLASVLLQLDGLAGIRGWQWLFLIEGIPAVILGFAALALLPDGPASASWLDSDEKRAIVDRLGTEHAAKDHDLKRALRDPRVLILGLANFGFLLTTYGIILWLPQIVQGMGFSNSATGWIVAAPYAAAAVALVLVGRSSDRRQERIWHVAVPALVGAAALAVASLAQDYRLVLVALSVAAVAVTSVFGPFFTLPSSFLKGRAAAGGIALFNSIGALSGFVGSAIIGQIREQTGGYAAAMAMLAAGLVVSALIVLFVGRALAPPHAALSSKVRRET